jgi:hypothetical protein
MCTAESFVINHLATEFGPPPLLLLLMMMMMMIRLSTAVPVASTMLQLCSPMSVFATKSMPGSAWMRLVFC